MVKKKIEMNRFHEIELEKSYDLIQSLESLRIQIGIFFATSNLGALSLGISQNKVVFFLFAALLFWIMIIIDLAIRRMLAHAYYRVTYIHKLYVKIDVNFSPLLISRLANRVINIVNMENADEHLNALRSLPLKVRDFYGFRLPIYASLIEILIGLFFGQWLGWSLI